MNAQSLQDFLHMGGYAAFVWPSYAVALAVLIWNVWAARAAHRRALADAHRRLARDEEPPTEPAADHWQREGARQ